MREVGSVLVVFEVRQRCWCWPACNANVKWTGPWSGVHDNSPRCVKNVMVAKYTGRSRVNDHYPPKGYTFGFQG